MKDALFYFRSRLHSPKALVLIISWLFLRLKKSFRYDFIDNPQKNYKIDVVIPTVPKDFELLKAVILSVRANILQQINKIFIVGPVDEKTKKFCTENNCDFIDELTVLGYGKEKINYVVNGVDRSGWLFQQLLKLSGEMFVEQENYFVLDSDTVLINKHNFIEDGRYIFLQNEEWNEPYFRTFQKLFNYKAPTNLSYTSHMMIFNRGKLKQMKEELFQKHQVPWDQAYICAINPLEASSISDYETYANWLRYNYADEVKSKPFYNKAIPRKGSMNLRDLENKYKSRFKSLSFHSYLK